MTSKQNAAKAFSPKVMKFGYVNDILLEHKNELLQTLLQINKIYSWLTLPTYEYIMTKCTRIYEEILD